VTAVRACRSVPAAVLLVAGLCGCSPRPGPVPVEPVSSPPVTALSPVTPLPPVHCASSLEAGPLPEWARGGFTGDGSSFRHVEGLRGAVVGVVFGDPLTAPPRPSRANKILWVPRERTTSRLEIDAQLEGTGPVVTRDVGFGGGQSIVDLPSPGCWRMTLRWGDQVTDTVDLRYVAAR
jgi:hypothetical protein